MSEEAAEKLKGLASLVGCWFVVGGFCGVLATLVLGGGRARGTDYYQPAPQKLLVPAYATGYSATDDLLKQILAELKSIRGELRLGPRALVTDGATVIQARCVACHQAGVAEDKGASVVLVEDDGSVTPLSLPERRRVKRMVESGRMPPSGALAEAEKKAVVDFVNQETKK